MNRRFLALCGMIAPVLFVFTAILGGALRPGYSHISDTVSELFSPGSPNKPLLDTLHTLYALLLTLFGVGLLGFVRRRDRSTRIGEIGAVLWIAAGVVSVATATVFPQDPWGSPATFPGQMHLALTGVVGLLSLLGMAALGTWFNRVRLFPGFRTYTWITIGAVIVSTVIFIANVGGPLMGLTERILALTGFQWTFTLARWLYLNQAS